MTRFVVVGCGTVVPEGDRGGSCYWLEADGRKVLLDCGPGASRELAALELPWQETTDIVLSHFHADHIGGLPGLFFAFKHATGPERERRPLGVWGPPGTRDLFTRLAGAFGSFMEGPGCRLEVREMDAGHTVEITDGLDLSTWKTPHTDESQALLAETDAARIGYTGDTGPEPALEEFFRGADLLVSECSLLDEEVGDNHMSPGRVARLARGASPGLLLLSHVYPHLRKEHDVEALVRAAGWVGRLEIATDGYEWTSKRSGKAAS